MVIFTTNENGIKMNREVVLVPSKSISEGILDSLSEKILLDLILK